MTRTASDPKMLEKLGPGKEGLGKQRAKQGDDRQPHDDETEPFELVAGINHDRS
jgi:hypothetical protein